jgi:hypothetical protein
MPRKKVFELLIGMVLLGVFSVATWAGQIGNLSGGSPQTLNPNIVLGNVFSSSTNFSISSVAIYVDNTTTATTNLSVAIYGTTGLGVPSGSPIRIATAPVTAVPGSNSVSLSSPMNVVAGTQYYVCVMVDTQISLDSIAGGTTYSLSGSTFPGFPVVTAPTTGSGTLLIFATGADFTPTPTHTMTRTLTPTSTVTPTASPSATITPTVTVTSTATLTPFVIAPDDVVAYPMPAKGSECWFYYSTTGRTELTFNIFNLAGEKVTTLTDIQEIDGYHTTRWNIRSVAPGIYLYQVKMISKTENRTTKMKKMVIVK